MKSNLHAHAPAFWSAMNPGVPLPSLPDAPLEAFRMLLEGTADGEFFSVGIYPVADPWPRVALGIATDHWQDQLSMGLTGLENVGGNHSGDRWYLDTEPDPAGLHRVYWRYHDTIDPMPLCAGLGPFLAYLTLLRTAERETLSDDAFEARLGQVSGLYDESHPGRWDAVGDDGWAAYAALFDHEFPDTWAQYARGEWVDPCRSPTAPASAAQRTWMEGLFDCFTAHRQLRCPPDLDRTALPPYRQRLLRELEALVDAIEGQSIPGLIERCLDDADPILAKAAHRWVTTFRSARPGSR